MPMLDLFQPRAIDEWQAGEEDSQYQILGKHGDWWYYDLFYAFETIAAARTELLRRKEGGEEGPWAIIRITKTLIQVGGDPVDSSPPNG